jgi:cyclase
MAGAGEILLNRIERDGTQEGYDLNLINNLSQTISIPLIVCGGAGNVEHFVDAISAGASAVAAGSMFVFQGKHRAVLISYPSYNELENLLGKR